MATILPVPGFAGWLATSEGEIISDRNKRPRVLSSAADAKGYLHLSYTQSDGSQRGALVHRLVLLAFVGMPPQGTVASHIDGDPSNNRPENLRWESPPENEGRKRGHGRAPIGERNGMAVIDPVVVRQIRALAGMEKQRLIAKRFGISQPQVSAIVNGRAWSHLD